MVHTVKGVNSLLDNVTAKPPADPVSFLYDRQGRRKYLTAAERRAFLKAGVGAPVNVRVFLNVLAYTGARISEVLALTPGSFDEAECLVVIESLKKRRRGVFRAVPLPETLIEDVLALRASDGQVISPGSRIWGWSRTTAWKRVKDAMTDAHITGPRACPKGLRHAFGVNSLQTAPLTVIKKWLGHARLSTTELYTAAVGQEERTLAARVWKVF
jgi:integrase